MKLADTFVPAHPIKAHLWVVIYCDLSQAAIVNLTTRWPGRDDSCIIQPGEHPFVQHETIVEYQHSRLLDAEQKTALERFGIKKFSEPVSEALLLKIQRGAIASQFTPQKIQALIQRALD